MFDFKRKKKETDSNTVEVNRHHWAYRIGCGMVVVVVVSAVIVLVYPTETVARLMPDRLLIFAADNSESMIYVNELADRATDGTLDPYCHRSFYALCEKHFLHLLNSPAPDRKSTELAPIFFGLDTNRVQDKLDFANRLARNPKMHSANPRLFFLLFEDYLDPELRSKIYASLDADSKRFVSERQEINVLEPGNLPSPGILPPP